MKSITVLSMLVLALTMISCGGAPVPTSPTSPSSPTPRDWVQIGTTLSTSSTAYLSTTKIDNNGVPHILYRNSSTSLTLVKWNGSSWSQVGTNFLPSASGNSTFDFIFDVSNIPFVASDAGTSRYATCVKYDSGYWQHVGTPDITSAIAVGIKMGLNPYSNRPFIAFNESTLVKIISFYSGAWNTYGVPFSGGTTSKIYYDETYDTMKYAVNIGNSLYYMRYSGGAWNNVGGEITNTVSLQNFDLAFDSTGTPYVAYSVSTVGVTVKKYNGSSWVNVGTNISHSTINRLNIISNGSEIFLQHTDDDAGMKACQVMILSNSEWHEIGNLSAATQSRGFLTTYSESVYFVYQNGTLSENILKKY